MADWDPSVNEIFLRAIEAGSPSERAAVLDRSCGDNVELRRKVEALLMAHDGAGSFLEHPAPGLVSARSVTSGEGATLPSPEPGESSLRIDEKTEPFGPNAFSSDNPVSRPLTEGPGTRIGPYKLLQQIGEGGMGAVFLTEQERPVRRQVALKLIKSGMDSRNVLARFDSERQALALMDHPHIARVFDAGTTPDGRPFFVMELVKGFPITEYCDQHHLDLPARLALFRQVCSAVQHAHQKGIIHRDLKPSNILVESHDDRPVPKVIDFGLAKATGGIRLTEHSLFTAFGTVAGTPLYMAPEQASFNALDVDTRADIYALGVILYELLTGSTPIARESIQRAALDEMMRVIREVEPPTPSSRIGTSEALPSLAASRQVEPARLARLVRGELDWIVMKALAKERERRYFSAVGLADDVECYLNHQPVSAGPPTAAYRLSKFVRRHRVQVVAASLVVLALVLGVVGTTLGLIEARRQEQIAVNEAQAREEARHAEAGQRGIAEQQRQKAEKRLGQVAKMNEILGSIFRDLDIRKAKTENRPLEAVLAERLDRATAAIEGEATGDPLAVARMQIALGGSQLSLGYPDRAIALFTKARATLAAGLGPDHPDTLESMNNLARSYVMAGQIDRALKLFGETLELRKAKLGPDHPDTLTSMNNLAVSFIQAGQVDRALRLGEETLALKRRKLGPDHLETLRSMGVLTVSYFMAGQIDRALKLGEETLELQKAKLGPDHLDTLGSMNHLAASYARTGQMDRALRLLEEALALKRTKLGPDHPGTLGGMASLAASYAEAGQFDRALKLGEETLELQKAKLGPDHPDTLTSMGNLADSYAEAGQFDRALKLFGETLELMKAKLGAGHTYTLAVLENQARCLADYVQLDRAEAAWDALIAARARPWATATATRSAPDSIAPSSIWPGAGSMPPRRPSAPSWTTAWRGSVPTTVSRPGRRSPWPGPGRHEVTATRPRCCIAPRSNRRASIRPTT